MSTELYSVIRSEDGPWQIICKECGWVFFSLSRDAIAALGNDWAQQRVDDAIIEHNKSHPVS